VAEEAVGMLGASLTPGLSIEADLQRDAAAVMASPTQLYQVVINLVTNALQAAGTGLVRVTLHSVLLTGRLDALHGSIAPGRYLRLEVADQGPGMTPEVLARSFDPFFTTKKPGEGTGLGLSVVHGIVADLGGCIDVVTSLGQGTRFSVWLPQLEDGAQGPALVQPAQRRGAGEVILVVDDERPLVELAEEWLAELGYDPVAFDQPQRALAAFLADPARFDALLTDEMMPDLPGSELARQVRALRPDLPVLVMSGHVGAELEAQVREVGTCALLHKPLALGELSAALSDCLAGARKPAA